MTQTSPVGKPILGLARPLTMRVRLNQRELSAITRAAELASITTSSWCRMILRKAAAADLHAAGKDPGL